MAHSILYRTPTIYLSHLSRNIAAGARTSVQILTHLLGYSIVIISY